MRQPCVAMENKMIYCATPFLLHKYTSATSCICTSIPEKNGTIFGTLLQEFNRQYIGTGNYITIFSLSKCT